MEQQTLIEKNEEQAELLPLLRTCWGMFIAHWYWFLLSVIVCLGLGFLYLQSQPRVYQRQAVMLIEDSQGGSMNGSMPRSRTRSNMTSLMELNGVSVGDNLKNEI
ncbi:MAG: tyrosine protein kinase, partial [Alloprevotella sp.]|nr:tyrosine protein kinase [Alloprevotella sp.]